MTHFPNAMAVFKLLEKSNCRKCNEPTCLAFAAAVFQGRRSLDECPRLDPAVVARYAATPSTVKENGATETLDALRQAVAGIDLAEAAQRLGGRFDGRLLTLKVLGKDFSVDGHGKLFSDIHIHPWVAVPFLEHILVGKGIPPTGRWVPFRELPDGQDLYPLFEKRCEQDLRQIADRYPDLFEDLMHLFSAHHADESAAVDADIALVFYPLPRLPMLIRYWKAEDEMASALNLLFDVTAAENLPIGSLFALATGLVRMFEKIALRHGVPAN